MEWIVILALAIILIGFGLVVREATASHHASRNK